ncbi:type VII secretion target [Rhodococcus sp. HNM0569]|uniref:type VII secretion target n=1 Tax=Rhodococcus sp. HNM0569 TaxID=2716340 RepID=UPI00146B8369|nr:hypothetical protein [Rhodococcus sp. HNM0569]
MSDSFSVDLDQLTGHAREIDGFGERTTAAAGSASQLAGMTDAFGLFCQPFGAMLSIPQQSGAQAVQATADAMRRAGDNLRAAVEQYGEADDGFAQSLKDIVDEIAPGATAGGR